MFIILTLTPSTRFFFGVFSCEENISTDTNHQSSVDMGSGSDTLLDFILSCLQLLHIPFHTIDGRTIEPHLGCNKHMPNKKACNFHDKHMDLHAILKKKTYVLPWCPCSNITSCPYFSLTTPHWDLANVPVRPATCSSNAGEAVFKSTPTEFTQDMVAPRNSWRKTVLFCLVEKRCLKVVRGFLKIWGLFSGKISM